MNREIIYRAFDNGEMITMPLNTNYGLSRFFGFLSESAIVMQYSGLKDKNNNNIFEGDVIKDILTKATLQVIFGHNKNNAYHGWYCKYIGLSARDISITGDYDTFKNAHIEIIGNIYENPNLLEVDYK